MSVRVLEPIEIWDIRTRYPDYFLDGAVCQQCRKEKVRLGFKVGTTDWTFTCPSCCPELRGRALVQFVDLRVWDSKLGGWEVDWRDERLFNVTARVSEYEHNGLTFVDVAMTLMKWDDPWGEKEGLIDEFMRATDLDRDDDGALPEEVSYHPMSVLAESFTVSEVEQVKSLLAGYRPKTAVTLYPAAIPTPGGPVSVGELAVGGPTDFYLFYKADGYDLTFDLAGYYDLRDHEALDANGRRFEVPYNFYLRRVTIAGRD